jgi:hypothetical protein
MVLFRSGELNSPGTVMYYVRNCTLLYFTPNCQNSVIPENNNVFLVGPHLCHTKSFFDDSENVKPNSLLFVLYKSSYIKAQNPKSLCTLFSRIN